MDRFDEFLANHWPHLVSRVARLEGMVAVSLAVGLAIFGMLIKMLVG